MSVQDKLVGSIGIELGGTRIRISLPGFCEGKSYHRII